VAPAEEAARLAAACEMLIEKKVRRSEVVQKYFVWRSRQRAAEVVIDALNLLLHHPVGRIYTGQHKVDQLLECYDYYKVRSGPWAAAAMRTHIPGSG
jgi:hypothetical protein